MNWIPLDIVTPAERDAVCLALYHAGYIVHQRRRKDGNKTVIYIEYGREGPHERSAHFG